MMFEIPKQEYKSAVLEVVLGSEGKSLKIGGENAPAFHFFEGSWPNPPRFAFEVYDTEPTDWDENVAEYYKDVFSSPVDWAKKCVDDYNAEAICLQLASIDPIEKDTPPEEAAALAKAVSDAIDVPVIVYGTGTEDKDAEVLAKVAEVCAGRNLFLGPAVKKNFDKIGEAALEFGHGVVIQTAMELPEAKELNLKLTKKNFPSDKLMYDPLTPPLGYGMEYAYSVMERKKLAGTSFGDPNLRMPILANMGKGCWETKEARESKEQGILWEAMTGLTYLLAGANVLIIRHPEVYNILKKICRGE